MDVERLIERLNGHRVYHVGQARGQGHSPLSTATGHTELARVLEEAAAALAKLQAENQRLAHLADERAEWMGGISHDLYQAREALRPVARYAARLLPTDLGHVEFPVHITVDQIRAASRALGGGE